MRERNKYRLRRCVFNKKTAYREMSQKDIVNALTAVDGKYKYKTVENMNTWMHYILNSIYNEWYATPLGCCEKVVTYYNSTSFRPTEFNNLTSQSDNFHITRLHFILNFLSQQDNNKTYFILSVYMSHNLSDDWSS